MSDILSSPKLFPSSMVLLSAIAAVRYGVAGDMRHTIYWIASAVLISAATF